MGGGSVEGWCVLETDTEEERGGGRLPVLVMSGP